MITIFHGEHIVKSRQALTQLIDKKKSEQYETEHLEAQKLTRADLESRLVRQDLFGTKQLIILEGLHSLPRSTRKNELIDLATQSEVELVLWEKRDLTKNMLKKFPDAQIKQFKLSSALFAWLDTLRGDQRNVQNQMTALHAALETEDAYVCFIMLARQVRLLIQIKDGGHPGGPPWLINKMKKQASTFSLEQLLNLHARLLDIDFAYKTSRNNLKLDQELDLLLASM